MISLHSYPTLSLHRLLSSGLEVLDGAFAVWKACGLTTESPGQRWHQQALDLATRLLGLPTHDLVGAQVFSMSELCGNECHIFKS